MRSISFFLVVCGSLLLTLYFVVDRDEPTPPIITEPVPGPASPPDEADSDKGNEIAFVHYDSEKGRPAYEFEGRFEDAFQSIQNPDHWVLHDGKLTIPIYDSVEESKASTVVFTFTRAEYRAQSRSSIKGDGVIELTGGGEGISDDGTRIRFEDLRIDIQKIYEDDKSKSVYSIRTESPVEIVHDLLSIESPTGMEGRLRDKDKLQLLTFHPPVRTYLDPRAASLFGVKMREAAPSETGPKDDAEADSRLPAKLAITCSGPLVLDRTVDPHRIEFRDNVRIYEVEKATPGEDPPLGDRSFHCQSFSMEFGRMTGSGSAKERLTISQAEASWEGDRVRAQYGDLRFDAEKLIWKQLGSDPAASGSRKILSEAVLTGEPHFQSEGSFELRSRSAVLRLDENRFVLRDDVRGTFHIPEEYLAEADSGSTTKATPGSEKGAAKAEKRFGLPDSLDFKASGVEVVLEDRDRSARGGASHTETGSATLLPGLRGVSRLLAYSDDDQGLVLESPGGGPFQLRGRLLTYDSTRGEMLLEGGANLPPRFSHPRGNGSAREIALMLKENVLRLRDRVFMDVQVSADRVPDASSEAPKDSPEKTEALRIVGEQLDVQFRVEERDPGKLDGKTETEGSGEKGAPERPRAKTDVAIHSLTARTLGKRPVTLTPLSQSAGSVYKIEGPNLVWDQEEERALMRPLDTEKLIGTPTPGLLARPRLVFDGGILETDQLEFDRKRWTADLTGKVAIRGTFGDSATAVPWGPGPSPQQLRTLIDCHRARVEFFEDFVPLPVERESNEVLRRIRSIHAWGDDQPISIVRDEYSARAQVASWNSETQELRLFGEGRQEFRRNENDTLLAEEIVYRRDEGRLELRRNVSGQILLERRVTPEDGGSAGPAEPTAGPTRPLVWTFRCPAVEAHVREVDGTLQPDRLLAHEDVYLACEAEGIQLHGDDLEYRHADQEIRIFSQHGRYQTLTHSQKDVQRGEIVVHTNKVDSREIRVWYKGYTRPAASPGTRTDHVVVRFDRDVNAAFYAPVPAAGVVNSSVRPGEQDDELKLWKLRANRLTMRLLLRGSTGPAELPYAYAEGEIDFSSDDMRAMASEAIFEKPANHLILRGDSKNPVRLYYKGRTLQKDEVRLKQVGKTFQIISK